MLIGNPDIVAIESEITRALPSRSQMALGFFAIHIAGKRYGVCRPDATLLGNSFDSVQRQLRETSPICPAVFATEEASSIAFAFISERYGEAGSSAEDLRDVLRDPRIVWAPDGDAAFDDGGHVLTFRLNSKQVRLIGFINSGGRSEIADSIRDLRVDAETFNLILSRWRDAFEAEWTTALSRCQH